MLVSYNWLRELVDFDWSPEELARKMTMAGLEFEGLEHVGRYKSDSLVVGKVTSAQPHENSDHLFICRVNSEKEEVTVICGAPNVAAGQLVPFAMPGTTLPNGFTIEKAVIRGVESSGMICSEYELGISENHDGIMVLDDRYKIGKPFEFTSEEDVILDFSVTSNRPDFLSIIGIARDISILSGNPLKKPEINIGSVQPDDDDFTVEIDFPKGCPRYSCRVIKNVKIAPSPIKIARRLNYLGFKSINNIVDATNYALLERGHPLHAFDLKQIKDHKIVVRHANDKEGFTTLDEVKRELHKDDVLICDGRRTVALGGVMGGKNSEVKNYTKNLLLESAYFNPVNVRWTAKRQVLSTEASKRFERGGDPNGTITALDRLTQLIVEMSPGCTVYKTVDAYPKKIEPVTIPFRYSRIKTILGIDVPRKQADAILSGLECTISGGKDTVNVVAPTFRPDLTREIDLIEEVARIYDYDNIPPVTIDHMNILRNRNLKEDLVCRMRNKLLGLGINEIFSNSMEDPQKYPLNLHNGEEIFIKNPVSKDMRVLRRSIVPGLYRAFMFNFNRQNDQVRLYEIGKVFGKKIGEGAEEDERLHLGVLLQGFQSHPSWRGDGEEIDFFTLKGILEGFADKIVLDNIKINPYANIPVEGIYEISCSGESVGFMGQLHNSWFKIPQKQKLYFWELDLNKIFNNIDFDRKFTPISQFPVVKRDLAVVVDKHVPYQNLYNLISERGGEFLENINLFDVFTGEQVGKDNKSIAISLRFQSMDRSLTDAEVQEKIDKILVGLQQEHNAVLRF